jgi:hypothetical protein
MFPKRWYIKNVKNVESRPHGQLTCIYFTNPQICSIDSSFLGIMDSMLLNDRADLCPGGGLKCFVCLWRESY